MNKNILSVVSHLSFKYPPKEFITFYVKFDYEKDVEQKNSFKKHKFFQVEQTSFNFWTKSPKLQKQENLTLPTSSIFLW